MKRRSLIAPLLVATTLLCAACPSATTAYVPKDPVLREAPLYFYRPPAGKQARALVFFFGNDVGFWEAHQRLAERLVGRGYDVIGFDVRRYFDTLPDTGAARAEKFETTMDTLVAHLRRELGDTGRPVVLAGHSLGADIAAWVAVHAPPPALAGVLLISPTARSHLYATARDRANIGETTEPGSFAAADLIRQLPQTIPVALVRGAHDHYRGADSAILAAGAGHVSYSQIPLAGHSLKSLTLTAPIIGRALDQLVR